jgi:hypothetical protein
MRSIEVGKDKTKMTRQKGGGDDEEEKKMTVIVTRMWGDLKEMRREVRTRQTVREEQQYDLPVAPSAASPAVLHNVIIYYIVIQELLHV